jgi:hypothetical protein
MTLQTSKREPVDIQLKHKKRRFVGNGEWYCLACGCIYTSLEVRSLNINPKHGCPNCAGKLRYEEV